MERTPRRTLRRFGLVGALALFGAVPAVAAAGAQTTNDFVGASCPATVDTTNEGWICSLLILNTPTDSPGEAQLALWSDELAARGREAVTRGIVFSDVSVEDKVRTIYRSELGREPEPAALEFWREAVQDAGTELAVELGVFGSGEYLSQFESIEAFVDDQYRYYLGREASREEQRFWADRFVAGDLSNEGITRAIATSEEAGRIRAGILYGQFARRPPDAAGQEYWAQRAAEAGLFPTIVDFAAAPEIVATLGDIGTDIAEAGEDPTPAGDPEQDIVVAPQEVVTTAAGEPVEITVLGRRGNLPLDGPVDLTLFPCEDVAATDSPVTFTDADGDGFADGIASTAADQAYISEVDGAPTGGRELYVDDVSAGDDDIVELTVISGPGADCAVIAVFEDVDGDRRLALGPADHATEPFGVTQVVWE